MTDYAALSNEELSAEIAKRLFGLGGESGPGARPMDIAWARSLRDQCQALEVAFFYKQGGAAHRCPHSAKGGHIECFPEDLRVREWPTDGGKR